MLLVKLLVFWTDLRNPVYSVPGREVAAEGQRRWEPGSGGVPAGVVRLTADGVVYGTLTLLWALCC